MVKLPFQIPSVVISPKSWAVEARLLRWLTLAWLLVGLVALFSASYPVGHFEYGDGLYYLKRQVVWAIAGWTGFEVIARSPLGRMLQISPWLLTLILGLILLTLVPGVGTTVNGATRWLALGSILIQPSELIKPLLVLQGATLFSQWNRVPWSARLFWLGVFASVLAGILLQPNLSTTALCGVTLWLVALAGGLPYTYLGATALGGILLAVTSISLQRYQLERLLSFLDPWADPQNSGYQLIQSLMAIGSGGLWGHGLGLSQQKLFYLPIQYTDFIFAVLAEEWGFMGGVLLLAFLGTYTSLCTFVAIKARYQVHQLVVVGGMVFLIGQALLNIGVATGALPTTGLPFPLVSYGGNSLIASLLLAGLMVRVARESNEAAVLHWRQRSSGDQEVETARP